MSSYSKVVASKKKRDAIKKKPTQLFDSGGAVGQIEDPYNWTPYTAMANGFTRAVSGQNPSDYLASRDPTAHAGQTSFQAQIPQGIVNAFDMGNPTVQAMHQQGVGVDFSGANAITPQQQALALQLQQQASGQGGPGQQLAQNMLNQATNQNIAQNTGMIASQRGINPAIAARMAGQNAAMMNQQAGAQGAQLGLQQQLAAQQQLSGVLSGMRQQGLDQAMGGAGVALQNQGQQLGAIGQLNQATNTGSLGAQEINAKVAMGNTAAKNAITGGLINAGGSVLASAAGQGSSMASEGGAAAAAAAHGMRVPGHASYAGDDSRNDTVNARLSPGEIVIPRSITEHEHAPYLAAEFVRKVLAGKGPKPKYAGRKELRYEGGGEEASSTDTGNEPGAEISGAEKPTALDPQESAVEPDKFATFLQGTGMPGAALGEYLQYAKVQADQDKAEAPSPENPLNTNVNTIGIPSEPQRGTGLSSPSGYMEGLNKAFGEQEAGIKQGAGASSQESREITDAYQDYIGKQKQAADRYQFDLGNLDRENQRLTQEYMNGKVDPQRFFNRMDTGSKIATAIGIALSGIGSGMSGQPNMAMSVINKMVEQDIAAQQSELGKKQTLLSMNLHKYGRLDQAYAATSAQMHALVQGQVAMAAAKSGDAKAQANAHMLMGQLDQQRAGAQQQAAALSAFSQGEQSGANIGDKIRLGIQSNVIPKELVPSAMKEYGEYNKLSNSLGTVDQAFDRVAKLQNISDRLGSPIQSRAQINAAEQLFSAQLAKDLEGKATKQDIDSIAANFPKLTDDADTVQKKRMDLHNSIKSKFTFPTLQSYGIVNKHDPVIAPTVVPRGTQTLQSGR